MSEFPNPPVSRGANLLALALLLCAWIPLAPMLTGRYFPFQHDGFLSDLLHAHLPYRVELVDRLRLGQLPQWWPDIYSGVPYLAQIETSVFYPPTWVTALVLDPYAGLDATWLLNTLLGAAAAWWAARLLGCHPLVATVVGVTWALGGGPLSHLKQPNMHAAILLLPLLLATAERARVSRGRWPLYGAAVGLHTLAGMPQITWVGLVMVLALHVSGDGPAVVGRRLGLQAAIVSAARLGLATALGLLVAAITLVPTWALKDVSARRVGLDWQWVADHYTSPLTLITLVLPVGPLPYTGEVDIIENWFYQGLWVGPLAAWGLLGTNAHRWRLAASAGALGLLTFDNPVSHAAFHVLPGMAMFRFHQRFGLAVALLVLLLAALGLQRLVASLRSPRAATALALAALVVTVVDASWFERHHLRWEAWAPWQAEGPITASIPAGGADGRLLHHLEWSRFKAVQAQGDGADPLAYRGLADVPLGSSGALHDRWSSGGYTNLLDVRTSAFFCRRSADSMPVTYQPPFWDAASGRPSTTFQSMLDRSATRWVLTSQPVSPDLQVVQRGASTLFLNPTALPRAYLATRWQPVPDLEGAARWMLEDGATRTDVPAVETDARPGSGRPLQPLDVRSDDPEHLVLDVDAAEPGFVVVTDALYPGWTATVDGRPAPLVHANGYQRAVRVDAGPQRITLTYRTPGLAIGAWISALAILLLVGWTLWERRRGVAPV